MIYYTSYNVQHSSHEFKAQNFQSETQIPDALLVYARGRPSEVEARELCPCVSTSKCHELVMYMKCMCIRVCIRECVNICIYIYTQINT